MKTKKRKQLSVLAVFLTFFLSTMTYGQTTTKTITLNYSESDFNYEYNTEGELMISSSSLHSWYSNDDNSPALPYMSYYVLIGMDEVFDSLKVQTQEETVLSNVTMAHNPSLSIASSPLLPTSDSLLRDFSQVIYPSSAVEYSGTHIKNGYRILGLNICPYVYNTQNLSLKLSTELVLTIHKHISSSNQSINYTELDNYRSEVLSMIENPEDISSLYPMPLMGMDSLNVSNSNEIDYLIITCDSLTLSFNPLATWKRMKGVKTEIITTQEIYNEYEGTSNQLKIKRCIQDYHSNMGTKYVLLGGDNAIIPVQYCYSKVKTDEENFTVADMFYGCFDGNYEWDANHNGIYGEVEDSVDYIPDVCITRIPVRTNNDVNVFVNRLLKYEKYPPQNSLDYKMLLCGMKTSPISDSFTKNQTLYQETIAPFWNGSVNYMFDTYSDMGNGFYAEDLKNAFDMGFSFINVMTHGYDNYWNTQHNAFTKSYVENIDNTSPTIVTSISCLVNAFNSVIDPCLSEAFMRKPNTGTIAFLGYSNDAIDYANSEIGPATEYVFSFYRHLFDNEKNNHFGTIVNNVKSLYASKCNKDGFRRNHYCLNPLGDPEMPIYKKKPSAFTNVDVHKNNNQITITTNIDSCDVCVMSFNDDGESYYNVIRDINSCVFNNVPSSVSACVMKNGYTPSLYYINDNETIIQNKIISSNDTYISDSIKIGKNVSNNIEEGPVSVDKGTTTIKASNGVLIKNNFEVKRGAKFNIEITN